MSDWEREHDRQLWRASQISNIYGKEAGQNYLETAGIVPGILILIAVCAAFPAILLIPLGLLLIWGGVCIVNAHQAKTRHQIQEAAIQRHQAAIDRLIHDLQIALKSGNDAAVGEVCRSLAHEEGLGTVIPLLQVALNDIDPCQRLCAVRGLRWGARSVSNDPQVKRPLDLLSSGLSDLRETTQIRVAAAIALGNGGYMDAEGLLFQGVADSNPDVRAACCHALGQLMIGLQGDASRVSILSEKAREEGYCAVLTALRDPHTRVRQEAAQALGHFRNPRALRPLQEILMDKSQPESVRRVVQDAVNVIKSVATV